MPIHYQRVIATHRVYLYSSVHSHSSYKYLILLLCMHILYLPRLLPDASVLSDELCNISLNVDSLFHRLLKTSGHVNHIDIVFKSVGILIPTHF